VAETLTANSYISHYRLVSKIGAGGMGEVFLAEDTKLDRKVAIKFLSEEFSRDEEKLNRFIQEAKAASALNHPNILTVYEIGEAGGRNYITTELIDGDTLRDYLLDKESLPLDTILRIGIQVAEALWAAHQAGIIHRDIKPENIMIRKDGYAKVLDFGLAKLLEPKTVETGSDGALRPRVHTTPGMVMGTVSYMSPEQARGKTVDARSDIFSCGVVLYELLTGRQPFVGETPADVMGSILLKEPISIRELISEVPQEVERIVHKTLEKEPDRRYQTAKDLLTDLTNVRYELEFQNKLERDSGEAKTQVFGVTRGTPVRQTGDFGAPPLPPKLSQITFTEKIEQYPAWSPNGEESAFSREGAGIRSIFVKNLASGEERQLTKGNYDDIQPAWSPDGKTILFVRSRQPNVKLEPGDVFGLFLDGDIWAIDLATQKETKLVENAFNPDYSPDGKRIAFDASWAGPRRIWAADIHGYNPQQLTSDVSEGISHVRPRWSPNGRRLVFQNIERTKFDVRVLNLADGESVWITNDAVQDLNPVWSPSGKFIYFSSYRGGGINIWRAVVSTEGTPVGAPQQLTIGAGQDVEIAISRNGNRLAFSILRQNADIWRLPVSPDSGQPVGPPQEVITTTREDSRGAWSPDGKMIAFNSDRTGEMNIWLHSLEDRQSRQLTKGSGGDFQANWSPDGKRIAFFSSRSGRADIWCVDVDTGELHQLTSSDWVDVNPFFSPDGNLIAYNSDRTGRPEVWVMRSDGSEARQLTDVGLGVMGHFMRWSQDGKSIIFRCPAGGTPKTGRVSLDGSDVEILPEVAGGSHMSLSPDNSRIMDVVGHKTLWVSPLVEGKPEKVFEFDDPDVRIDYPVWSPDGYWILFDRFRPQGGDIWMMEQFE
jgi:Tol biopolymer transport system component